MEEKRNMGKKWWAHRRKARNKPVVTLVSQETNTSGKRQGGSYGFIQIQTLGGSSHHANVTPMMVQSIQSSS